MRTLNLFLSIGLFASIAPAGFFFDSASLAVPPEPLALRYAGDDGKMACNSMGQE
jgi:hypothetical protein